MTRIEIRVLKGLCGFVALKCGRTSRIDSLLSLSPLYTFMSKNVVSVSEISAVSLMGENFLPLEGNLLFCLC